MWWRRFIIGFSLFIGAVLAGLSYFITPDAQRNQWFVDSMVNAGTGIVITVVGFAVFTLFYPAIKTERYFQEKYLDVLELMNRIPKVRSHIRIMDNWTPYLNADWYATFTAQIHALNNRVRPTHWNTITLQRKPKVEVLLLHPESEAANIRHQQRPDMPHDNGPIKEMRNNLKRFRLLSENENKGARNLDWDIRISKVPLLVDLYEIDQQGVFGFYPPTSAGHRSPHLWFPKNIPFGEFMKDFFERVWNDVHKENAEASATIVHLDDYWRLRLQVTYDGNPEGMQLRVKYLYLNGRYYISLDEFLRPHAVEHEERGLPDPNLWVKQLFDGTARNPSFYFPKVGKPCAVRPVFLPDNSKFPQYSDAVSTPQKTTVSTQGLSSDSVPVVSRMELKTRLTEKYHSNDRDIEALSAVLELAWPDDITHEEKKAAYVANPGLDRTYLLEPDELPV